MANTSITNDIVQPRPALNRATTSQHTTTSSLRRGSAPLNTDPRNMGDYFMPAPVPRDERVADNRRRSSSSIINNVLRSPVLTRKVMETLYPPDEQLIEPFSFVSTKTSLASAAKLAIGLLGQAGYTFGSILLVNSLYQVPNPPGLAAGVGSTHPQTPDGMLAYEPPSVAIGASVFGVGIVLGLASSVMFLADGLRIAGNRRKAFTYVSMHLCGIVLICLSKFIITLRKNHTPLMSIIALSIPAGIGRGLHAVTIPRSFSNSEIVNGDFARLSFEQRQIASEVLRVTAFIFFGLWAASWSVANFDPLEREGWGILASLTLNLSAALPNTNLRRADIFRRSQQNLMSPGLQSFQLRSINVRSPEDLRSPTPRMRALSHVSERTTEGLETPLSAPPMTAPRANPFFPPIRPGLPRRVQTTPVVRDPLARIDNRQESVDPLTPGHEEP